MNLHNGVGNSDSFHWHQVPNGTWQRDIDEAERFYTTLCRKPEDTDAASFAITCHVSLSVPSPEGDETHEAVGEKITNALRAGWLALCHETPTLASWTQYNSSVGVWKKTYMSFHGSEDSLSVSSWLSQSFRQVDLGTDDEWLNTDPPVFKLATLFLVTSPSGQGDLIHRKVYLRCPHDVVDGIGILHLLNRLLELADNTYHREETSKTTWDGNESSFLSPPLNGAIGIRNQPTDAQRHKFNDLLAKNAALQTEKPFLGLRLSAEGRPDSIQRVSFSLPKSSTAELVKISKLHGITITHLVSAALLIALRDFQSFPPGTPTVRYCNQSLVNLRGLCLSSQDRLAVGNYHMIAAQSMAIDLSATTRHNTAKESEEEMISVAKQFREYYALIRPSSQPGDQDLLAFIPMTWDLFTPKPTSQPPPQLRSASVSISSLGDISRIVKHEYGVFSVTDTWVAGETLGTGVSTFIQTFAGKLGFSTIFNLAFHQKERIEALQDIVLKKLTGLSQ